MESKNRNGTIVKLLNKKNVFFYFFNLLLAVNAIKVNFHF